MTRALFRDRENGEGEVDGNPLDGKVMKSVRDLPLETEHDHKLRDSGLVWSLIKPTV